MDELIKAPFYAYKGEGPYIFVSYSHKDSERVFPMIKRFNDDGFNIWYDEGIEPGNEWPLEIERALKGCAVFLVFITASSVRSRNVRNEINYAFANNLPVLAIHLEETELIGGLALQMGSTQAIMQYRMEEDAFYYKSESVFRQMLGFETTERPVVPVAPIAPVVPVVPDDKPVEPKPKKKKSAAKAAVIIILLVCILGGGAYFARDYFKEYLSYLPFFNEFFDKYDITDEVMTALRNGEFKEAQRLYDDVVYSDDLLKLENRLHDRLDDLKSEFETGDINYADASSEITAIRSFRIRALNSKIDSIEADIENIENLNNTQNDETDEEIQAVEIDEVNVEMNVEEEVQIAVAVEEVQDVQAVQEQVADLPEYRAVTSITGVPESVSAGSPLTLTGTVNPSDAENRRITWSVANAGTTGAVISGRSLNTTAAGTVTVRAIIDNGEAEGRHYIQDFNITVTAPVNYRVSAETNNAALGRGAVWIGTGGDKEADWVSSRSFAQGSTVHIRAFPNHGYAFDKWEISARNGSNITLEDASSVSASFRIPAGDVTVRAVFKLYDSYVVNVGRSVLNVREAPDVNSEVIERLNNGDVVQIARIVTATDNINGDWAWIGYGWCNMDYLLPRQ